jgi:hypothetical protein
LAQALRVSGRPEKARDAAHEGLALLAPFEPGTPGNRIRRLPEDEARR